MTWDGIDHRCAVIASAREVGGFSLLLDVEVPDEEEANEAIAAGADVIMLDNIEGNELGFCRATFA